MSYTAQLIIGTLTDFILTAGGVLTGGGVATGQSMPTRGTLLAAAIFGIMAGAKHLNGMLVDPAKPSTMTPAILKTWLLVGAVAFSLAGCAVGHVAPGYVKCKGKGVITGSGSIGGGMLYGGGGLNAYTLSVDCGEGLEFEQGRPAPEITLPPR